MIYEVSDEDDPEKAFVRVANTHVGKGVFAMRAYPGNAIIGEITGDLFPGTDASTEYTFDFEHGLQLEPFAPFRYVNHSCDPNCEFDVIDIPASDGRVGRRGLFLNAVRNISEGEELSIAYNWPASFAIECHCGSENCVGWIVCDSEIDLLEQRYDDDFEQQLDFTDHPQLA